MIKGLRNLLCALACYTASVSADTGLKIVDARIMITPPGVSVTAGLMSMVNETDSDIRVLSVSALGFERVEIHKTELKDGVARMRHVDYLTIPAGDTLVLENGGYHMMLYAPERSFSEDDSIEVTLTTSAGTMTALVPVRNHFTN